jgi:hypothetical protein
MYSFPVLHNSKIARREGISVENINYQGTWRDQGVSATERFEMS